MKQIKYCTDIVYFGSEITADGKIKLPANGKRDLHYLAKECHKRKVRLILCLGGWGKDKYFPVVSQDSKLRLTLLKEINELRKKYKLKGVDYDWEYPRTDEEMKNFTALCSETQKKFPDKFLVTAAFAPSHNIPKALTDTLDRVHLMTYDMGREHCHINHSKHAIQKWKANKVPNEKICIGAAFYARNINNRADVKTYGQLIEEHGNVVKTTMPVADYFSDNEQSLKEKLQLIKENKIKGLIIWEIGQDTFGEDSLLKFLYKNR